MIMHLRRKLVAGNWKMNGSLAALAELGPIVEAAKAAGGVDVALCPPFTLIAPAVTRSGGLVIGAQDCHAHDSGAHTGCVSVAMLREAGARLVIWDLLRGGSGQASTRTQGRSKRPAPSGRPFS